MDLLRRNPLIFISQMGLLIAACILSGGAANADAPSHREYQIKAAFLYNFTKFIEWPANSFADETAPMILCVIGKDPFGPILEQTLTGKTVKGRAIIINRLKDIDNLKSCHILFVSSSERERVPQIVRSLSGVSVLTAGDMNHFAKNGGIINLTKRANKIRFEINRNAADRARLKLSSKLLNLATIVGE